LWTVRRPNIKDAIQTRWVITKENLFTMVQCYPVLLE